MAVENKVSIYGQIRKIKKKPVKSIKQGGGGMYVSMAVMVSRRRRAGFGVINGANRIDVVTVLFRSARLVDRLLDPAHPVRENDMIYIYGVFCTVPVRRRWLCPSCGEENFLGQRPLSILWYSKYRKRRKSLVSMRSRGRWLLT